MTEEQLENWLGSPYIIELENVDIQPNHDVKIVEVTSTKILVTFTPKKKVSQKNEYNRSNVQ